MIDLILVGAGGYAREIYELIIKSNNRMKPAYNVLGAIDDNLHALDGKETDLKILGTIKDWKVKGNEKYVMSIASPQIKQTVAQIMHEKGAEFASLIHFTVICCSGAKYGEGFIAYPGAVLGPDDKIGDFVTLLGTGLAHDVEVGDYSTVSSYCGINGNVHIGKRVFIGGHAVLAPGMKIGDDAFVCTGSVVVTPVRKGMRVFGNPAHKMDI
ncbi:MAG: sugar O-acyltransferase [Lentisphaeria bacterium]|nr:sugar O-acyltransferase [Lentisphaeria bacterium]